MKSDKKRNKQTKYEPVSLYDIYEPRDTYPEDTEQGADGGVPPGPDYPFHDTVERVVGGATYIVSTECAGKELLGHKLKRLISSDSEQCA